MRENDIKSESIFKNLTNYFNIEAAGNKNAESRNAAYCGIVTQEYSDSSLSGSEQHTVLNGSRYYTCIFAEMHRCIFKFAGDEKMEGWREASSVYLLSEYFAREYAENRCLSVPPEFFWKRAAEMLICGYRKKISVLRNFTEKTDSAKTEKLI